MGAAADRSVRPTHVLHADEVADDETLHPGAVVWLPDEPLADDELARFDRGRTGVPRRRHLRIIPPGHGSRPSSEPQPRPE